MEFTELKRILKATDGNLGSHIATLEKAGYIEVTKDFANKKPRTRAKLTTQGRREFNSHVSYLREILSVSSE